MDMLFLATLAVFLALTLAPLAMFLARVADSTPLRGIAGKVEQVLYRAAGVDAAQDMPWTRYAVAAVSFNALGAGKVYLVQRLQAWLPWNPQHLTNVAPDSAFDTAVSFVTNTNWQGYAGESTLSYFTQMLALTVQNFFFRRPSRWRWRSA